MMFRVLLLAFMLFLGAEEVLATTPPASPENPNPVSAFRQLMRVAPVNTVVPTVVEVPFLNQYVYRHEVLVVEEGTGRILPSYLNEQYATAPSPVTAVISTGIGYGEYLVDTNLQTGVQFELPEERVGTVRIRLSSPTPIVSSAMAFVLERNVSLPTSIEIRVEDGMGGERIVLAKSSMLNEYVDFLPTSSFTWIIDLTYAQPLKINELKLIQDNPERSVTRGIRFLAQPAMAYTVYFDPDRSVSLPYVESGNLTSDVGVLKVTAISDLNSQYVMADVDGDGAWDTIDNCVTVSNPSQTDIDQNGRGDDCEDFDRDGITNTKDNCANIPNGNQYDEDHDGIGDVCDKEESRFTERLPWVPWVGMGIAAAVLIGLFVLVGMRPMKPQSENNTEG